MIAETLIHIARSRLGDEKTHRWTDTRMLQIVNQGQANICKLAGIYRREAHIALANNETRYLLPSDCMTVNRLEYKGKIVPIFSRDDIDFGKQPPEEFIVIKDNLAMNFLDIYPPLTNIESDIQVIEGTETTNLFTVSPIYGVVTQMDDALLDSYGVLTGVNVEYTVEDSTPTIWGEVCVDPDEVEVLTESTPTPYGVTTQVFYDYSEDPNLFGFITGSDKYKVVGQYGLVATIAPLDSILKVYYLGVPTDLKDKSTTLVIPDMWEEAMVRYIVGTALQDDNDANNIQRGELELQKYTTEVLKARELATKDFSGGARDKLRTRFRRI